MNMADLAEADFRRQIDYVLGAFVDGSMPTVAAAVCLTCLFPAGDEAWQDGCRAAMTMLLQDLAEFPEKKDKIAVWLVNTILNNWHEVRTGEEVMAAAGALQSRGRVIVFDPDSGTFSIDGHGPYSTDDILDEASRL